MFVFNCVKGEYLSFEDEHFEQIATICEATIKAAFSLWFTKYINHISCSFGEERYQYKQIPKQKYADSLQDLPDQINFNPTISYPNIKKS